jgi:hypothetical protein
MIVKAVKALILFVVGVLALGLVEPALAEETPNAADAPQPDGEHAAGVTDAVTGVTQTVDSTVRSATEAARATTSTTSPAATTVQSATSAVDTTVQSATTTVDATARSATSTVGSTVRSATTAVDSTVRPVVEETARAVAPVTQAVGDAVRPVTETARETVDDAVGGVTSPPPGDGGDRGADAGQTPSRSASAGDKPESSTHAPEQAGGGEPPRAAPAPNSSRQPARTMRPKALAGSGRADRRGRDAHARKRHARGQRTVRHSPAALDLDLTEAPAASATTGEDSRSDARRDDRRAGAGDTSRLPHRTHRGPRSTGSTASAASGSGPVPACGRPGFQLASDGELRRLRADDARRPDDPVVLLLERPG